MKKLFSLFGATWVALSMFSATLVWDGGTINWTLGSGTEVDPYLIESPQQLAFLSEMVSTGVSTYAGVYFQQTNDFDLDNVAWTPIGATATNFFAGHYDGNGKSIYNVKPSGKISFSGLFGCTNNVTIKNLTISQDKTAGFTSFNGDYKASVIGYAMGETTVINCHNEASLSANGVLYVGGLVGYSESSITIDKCSNKGEIRSQFSAGGDNKSFLQKLYAGGIVGYTQKETIITDSHNEGDIIVSTFHQNTKDITSTQFDVIMGGICGHGTNVSANNCYNIGDVKNLATSSVYSGSAPKSRHQCCAGGLFGETSGTTIMRCYNNASVAVELLHSSDEDITSFSDRIFVGGIVGNAWSTTKIMYCYVRGDLSTYGPSTANPSNYNHIVSGIASVTTRYITTLPEIANSYFCGEIKQLNTKVARITESHAIASEAKNVTNAYANNTCKASNWTYGTSKTTTIMKSESFPISLNAGANEFVYDTDLVNDGYPILSFQLPKYWTISTNADNGIITGGGYYKENSIVTLQAIPDEHYHFVQWEDGDTNPIRQIIVSGDAEYTAIFAIDQFTITVSAENGSITGGGTYDYGTEITLVAILDEHYHFVKWNDGDTNSTKTLIITTNESISAVFAINQYEITCGGEHGMVTGGGLYDYGTQIILYAIPDENYHFVKWSDGEESQNRSVIVTESANYLALFEADLFTIQVKSINETMGSVLGSGQYPYDSDVIITAVANNGYEFSKWSDGNKENPRSIHVSKNAQYVAMFTAQNYSVLVLSSDEEQGSVIGSGEYAYNTTITIEALPNVGYSFLQWDDGNTDNPRTILITDDVIFIAQFIRNTGTNINEPIINSIETCKYIKDNHLIIQRGDKYYDARGVRIN